MSNPPSSVQVPSAAASPEATVESNTARTVSPDPAPALATAAPVPSSPSSSASPSALRVPSNASASSTSVRRPHNIDARLPPSRTPSVASQSASSKEPELFSKQVNSLALDYLMAECVPLSLRVQDRLLKNERDVSALMASLDLKDDKDDEGKKADSGSNAITSEAVGALFGEDFQPGRVDYMGDDGRYLDPSGMYRVEKYGYEIGYKVTDCLVYARSSAEGVNVKLQDTLEMMKFICRDTWKVFYGKQMDNLRTNHIGTFVLIDNNFKPLRHFWHARGEQETLKKVPPHLQFPCGLIRGILASLGVSAVVTAEVSQLPGVTFNVQTNPQ